MDCFGQKPCNSIFATGLCHIRYPRVSVFKLMPYLDSETLRSQSCLKQRWLPLERQGRFHVLSSHKQNIRQHPQWKHAPQTKQSMVTQKSNCCETMHVCEQKLFFISLGKVLFSYAARLFVFPHGFCWFTSTHPIGNPRWAHFQGLGSLHVKRRYPTCRLS